MYCKLASALMRKKTAADPATEGGQLARVLSLLDLTALGIGSTLGLGVYVLAGAVAKSQAGPAVCLSFLVAAVASAVAALCYAEFASRVPKAGSAYVYSYVSVGEFVAYIIGWNLVLEYVIGTASVARGLSGYIDALVNNSMSSTMREIMPINVSFLSTYPDFLSLVFIAILTGLLSFGVKESTTLNNAFTALNLTTIIVVLIAGSIKADINNWKIPKESIPDTVAKPGEGGFFPFGFSGVMTGAATCFYAFVGFDTVAATGEEAKNPQRNIPLAIVILLFVVFLAYFGISTVLTLMWPYYDQNADAPFPYAFDQIGWPTIKWMVTIGAIFALCTSLLGCMFPLPRIIYAMSSDGLLFKFLAKIHPKTKTPLIATVISGVLAGIMAAIFNLQQLIDMMSIGTLLAYTVVALCVLILRYEDQSTDFKYPTIEIKKPAATLDATVYDIFKQIFNLNNNKYPDNTSYCIAKWNISIFSILSICLCAFAAHGGSLIESKDPFYVAIFVVLVVVMAISLIIIARQPTADLKIAFKVPLVPLIPCISVVINIYLMMQLDAYTWVRFIVWLIIGFAIYFLYGMKNSEERIKNLMKERGKRPSSAATASVHSEKKEDDAQRETTKF